MADRHQYFADPAVGRLLGVVLAMAGELFVARSEIELIKAALADKGLVSEVELDTVNNASAMQDYLVRERGEYARDLFGPARHGDYAMEQHWDLLGAGPDPDRFPEGGPGIDPGLGETLDAIGV